MFFGAAWLVTGVVLTALTYWIFDWKGGVLFYGAVIVGSIQFLVGVFQRLHYATLSDSAKANVHAQAALVTLLRCMALVANADGKVTDTELTTMASILNRLVGQTISLDQIKRVVATVGHGIGDVSEFVGSKGTQTSLEGRVLIAKACFLVMNADGDASKKEERVFKEIVSGLALPSDTLEIMRGSLGWRARAPSSS